MKKRIYNFFYKQRHIEYIVKRIIYIICAISFCYLDHIVGSATGYIQNGYRNYTAVILTITILTSYKFKDFIKWPYFIWGLLYLIFCLLSYDSLCVVFNNRLSLIANLWQIGLLGILLIRMFYYFVIEKEKIYINRITIGIFSIMSIGMMIIRSDLIWTITLLGICFLYYLSSYKPEDMNNLIKGILEGIIIGFFLVQIQAWQHRPYDTTRYEGLYSHANMNALFYLCVYCAILAMLYYVKLKKKNILINIPLFLIAGLVIGTMFYTGGRAAFITFIVTTFVFLVFILMSSKKRRLLHFIANGLAITFSIVICLLPAYWLIRYVPGYINEPLYFEADIVYMDKKIQKNESIYSEKYTEFNESMDIMFERYLWFFDKETARKIERFIRDFPDSLSTVLEVEAATIKNNDDVEPGSDQQHPIKKTGKKGEEGYDVRIDIYRYFWNKLELIGNKNNPIGVWTSRYNFAGHCHNLFLQIAYDFGIIVGVIFILFIMVIYVWIIIGLVKDRSPDNYFRLFVAIIYITLFVVFGMLEIDWRYGQLSFTMFFIVQYVIHHKVSENTTMAETSSMDTSHYIVPEKGGFKELVVMDLDVEEID